MAMKVMISKNKEMKKKKVFFIVDYSYLYYFCMRKVTKREKKREKEK